jgi:hypothetical protein
MKLGNATATIVQFAGQASYPCTRLTTRVHTVTFDSNIVFIAGSIALATKSCDTIDTISRSVFVKVGNEEWTLLWQALDAWTAPCAIGAANKLLLVFKGIILLCSTSRVILSDVEYPQVISSLTRDEAVVSTVRCVATALSHERTPT